MGGSASPALLRAHALHLFVCSDHADNAVSNNVEIFALARVGLARTCWLLNCAIKAGMAAIYFTDQGTVKGEGNGLSGTVLIGAGPCAVGYGGGGPGCTQVLP